MTIWCIYCYFDLLDFDAFDFESPTLKASWVESCEYWIWILLPPFCQLPLTFSVVDIDLR